jgi:L-lysine 2,3-aminomutase
MTSLALQNGYVPAVGLDARRYKVFMRRHIDQVPQLSRLSKRERDAMKAVSAVLPFRVNNYVVEELIDWSNLPSDPMFQLTFPQPAMLSSEDFGRSFRRNHSGGGA